MQDCIIIGGGPAGLTAAIYLARFRRAVLLLDGGNSRCAWIPRTHNHAGFPDGINGRTLLERMTVQAQRYGARLERSEVAAVQPADTGFRVERTDGRQEEARFILLATGVQDRQPHLPDLWGAVQSGRIRVCPVCDAHEVIGQSIAVLGDNRHSLGEALFLRGYSDRVALLHHGDADTIPPADRRHLEAAGIMVVTSPVRSVDPEGDRITVGFADGSSQAFDTLYSALGTKPRTGPVQGLDPVLSEDGRLTTDAHQETSAPGLFAAGDIVSGLNQIAVAMGQAAVAATAIHNRLRQGEGRTL